MYFLTKHTEILLCVSKKFANKHHRRGENSPLLQFAAKNPVGNLQNKIFDTKSLPQEGGSNYFSTVLTEANFNLWFLRFPRNS